MKVTYARADGGGSLRPRLVSYFRCAYKVSLRLYFCAINLLYWAVGEAQAAAGGLPYLSVVPMAGVSFWGWNRAGEENVRYCFGILSVQ